MKLLKPILVTIFLMSLSSSVITYFFPQGNFILNLMSGLGLGFFYLGPKVNEYLNQKDM